MKAIIAALFLLASCAEAKKPDVIWAKGALRHMRQNGGKGGSWPDETCSWPQGGQIDWELPPAREEDITESSCLANWKYCSSVTWQRRLEFVKSPFQPHHTLYKEIFAGMLPKPNVSLSVRRQTVSWTSNLGRENVTMKINGIGQNISDPQNKWLARADLVHDAKNNDTHILFSESRARYVQSYDKKIKRKFVCGPNELCAVQTLTFHVAMAGICRPRPMVICKSDGTKEDLCNPLEMRRRNHYAERVSIHRFDSCEQYNRFVWDSCYTESNMGPLPVKCSMPSVPLAYNGKPVFVLHFIRSKINKKLAGRALSSEAVTDWSKLIGENDIVEEEIFMIDDEE
ncbi:hypothetical protein CP533_3770 [Ophiocordyceps camponoti-saundersi (nom. inval.)]|nr:hypothetical protein CP533_3770 [Ophiocordyceps camponoti-saundersi (nom. inval.)]